jgi:hypothetical protein
MYERTYNKRVLKPEMPKPRAYAVLTRVAIAFGIGLIVWGIIFSLRYHKFQIQTIAVQGAFVIVPQDVQDFVKKDLEGKYLKIIPKASIFLLREKTLRGKIAQQFPYAQTINIKRTSMSSIAIDITEYKGVYLWCIETDADCYFMNKNGLVFSPAPYFSGSAYIKIFGPGEYGDKKDFPFVPLDANQFVLVDSVSDILQTVDIHPIAFHFDEEHSLAISFVHNGATATLFVDPSKDVRVQIDALASAMNTSALSDLYANETKKLEYLDTRFDSKVVYKFQ